MFSATTSVEQSFLVFVVSFVGRRSLRGYCRGDGDDGDVLDGILAWSVSSSAKLFLDEWPTTTSRILPRSYERNLREAGFCLPRSLRCPLISASTSSFERSS